MGRAYASCVINAPAQQVWEVVRDFNALPQWHPDILESTIENDRPSDAVGCIRNFALRDGTRIREKLLSLSDKDRTFVYDFQTWPFPVQEYEATFRVFAVTEGNGTFVEWWATYDCDLAQKADLEEMFGRGVFAKGLAALKERCEGR